MGSPQLLYKLNLLATFLYNNVLLSFLICFLHKLIFYSNIPSKFTALPCSFSIPEKGCHLASNSLLSPGSVAHCFLGSWFTQIIELSPTQTPLPHQACCSQDLPLEDPVSPTILPSWIILRRNTSARRKKMIIHQSAAANFGVYEMHWKCARALPCIHQK